MGAYYAKCPVCAAEFHADRSQEGAYQASLGKGDQAETKRLLGVINAAWAVSHHMEAEHPEAMFECPRQAEGMKYDGKPAAFWEDDGTCSYCGSLSPVRFFECVEAGCEVTPTDKSYKAYIDAPEAHPNELVVVGSAGGPEKPGEGWIPAAEVDDEILKRSGFGRHEHDRWLLVRPRGRRRTAKFYFQHFDGPDRARFIKLVNGGRMKMAYPGYFYRLPYFCDRAPD